MIGAIIGDIAGSVWEFHPSKTKDFEFFDRNSQYTDDTVMSLAICEALMACRLPIVSGCSSSPSSIPASPAAKTQAKAR